MTSHMDEFIKQKLGEYNLAIDQAIKALSQIDVEVSTVIRVLKNLKTTEVKDEGEYVGD